jgi:hypothetical protein
MVTVLIFAASRQNKVKVWLIGALEQSSQVAVGGIQIPIPVIQ